MLRRSFALLLSAATIAAVVQSTTSSTAGQVAGQPADVMLTGTLNVVWGDPAPGSPASPLLVVTLTDAAGTSHELTMEPRVLEAAGGLHWMDGQTVSVVGRPSGAARFGEGQRLDVTSLTPAIAREPGSLLDTPTAVTGPQTWITILCRFGDSPGVTPQQPSYFDGMFGSGDPGLDHFWREVSYDNISIAPGPTAGWFDLPSPRSAYFLANGNANLSKLAEDCSTVADAVVHFPSFIGLSFGFNQNLDCCAWGGGVTLNRDGVTKSYRSTWMPPWAQVMGVYAHEMGHGFGFPHSSGPYSTPYDSSWDPMSNAHNNKRPGPYGPTPDHTITYHKNLAGWISDARRFTAPPGASTITIDGLSQPPPGGTYLMARIPIGGVATRFYTVEARRFVGYDAAVPSEAIVIHNVDESRTDRDAQVVDATNDNNPNDAGAAWTPGETFVDPVNYIRVSVGAQTSAGWTVTIVKPDVLFESFAIVVDSFNHNGYPDPGETVTLAITLRNTSAVSTTGVTAALVGGDQNGYGTIAPGATNTQNFTFVVPNVPCGTILPMTLNVTSVVGTIPQNFTLLTGSPGGGTAPLSQGSGNLATPIVDLQTVDIPVVVNGAGVVADVNVKFRLNHTFDSDLAISLVAPDGAIVSLSNRRGGNGDNFGTGANDCSGTPVTFDDGAATLISSGVAPFAGSYKPEAPLAAMNGRQLAGTWKLRIADQFGGDTGIVGCVQLDFVQQIMTCATGPCSYSLSQTAATAPASGGSGLIGVVTQATCGWSAASSVAFLNVTSALSGTGPGAVSYSVGVNNGPQRNGTLIIGGQTFTVTQDAGTPILDLNLDGGLDLLWHHQTTGQIAGWLMNGTQLIDGTLLNPSQVPDTTWKVVGAGDLDGDAQIDIVWQNVADGRTSAWLMNGLTLREGALFSIPQVPDLQWKIRGVGDLNGDRRADLFWQHEGTGQLAVWLMNGLTVIDGTLLTPSSIADLQWQLVGTGDFDRNGSRDLVFHHQGDGRIALWFMNGTSQIGGSVTSPPAVADLNWKIRAVGDLNGDARPDFVWQNIATGQISVWLMNGLNLIDGTLLSTPVVADTSWHVVGPR